MKQTIRFAILSFIFLTCFRHYGNSQNPTGSIDCAKLDMYSLVNFFTDAVPLQVSSYYSNLKRLEDCVNAKLYESKESVPLIDRQISLIAASRTSIDYFQESGLSDQLGWTQYMQDMKAALDGLGEYGKALKALAKEKTETTQKNIVIARKRNWEQVAKVTLQTSEEK